MLERRVVDQVDLFEPGHDEPERRNLVLEWHVARDNHGWLAVHQLNCRTGQQSGSLHIGDRMRW